MIRPYRRRYQLNIWPYGPFGRFIGNIGLENLVSSIQTIVPSGSNLVYYLDGWCSIKVGKGFRGSIPQSHMSGA